MLENVEVANATKNPVVPDRRVLAQLENRIKAGKPTFLSSLNPIFPETVKVVMMLSELINQFEQGPNYKTFFCNSQMEALHGAIKLARYNKADQNAESNGAVVVLDPQANYESYFDSVNKGVAEALIPGVRFVQDASSVEATMEEAKATIFVCPANHASTAQFLATGKQKGWLMVLDFSSATEQNFVEQSKALSNAWDIVIWGEGLAAGQFPVGAFSAKPEVYKVWNTHANCLLHSSTFGGNGMVMEFVFETLKAYFSKFSSDAKYLQEFDTIEVDPKYRVERSRDFLNAFLPLEYKSSSLDVDLLKAEGNYLTIRTEKGKTREIFDCVGGSGCSVRGHNSKDIIPEVLQQHDFKKDYVKPLQQKLEALTGLPNMFMGVSGASVVEMGMMLGLNADPNKKKIIVFRGNYAGKTLLAMNGTIADNSKFGPLYNNVILLNPFTTSARVELEKLMQSGEIGLIWFENIQGGGLLSLPPDVLSLIGRKKEEYGFYVGIDEILHGVYRTGPFLSYDQGLIEPDIITMSKGMSDMVYPLGTTLVSDRLYNAVQAQNPALIERLTTMYRNDFAAHIALHTLLKLEELNISENVTQLSKYINTEVQKLVQNSKHFKSVEIKGLHLRVNMDVKTFPFNRFNYSESCKILTSVFYDHGLLTFFGRMLPPMSMNKQEADELLKRIKASFDTPGWKLYLKGRKQQRFVKKEVRNTTNLLG